MFTQENIKMLQCSHCPKEFRYISERKRHELSHSPLFECNTCSKKFSFVRRRPDLGRRSQSNVQRAECANRSDDQQETDNDNICIGVAELRFAVNKCVNRSALRRHQKQHERTESVQCEECNHTFLDEVLLKRHIQYAHKGTFTCEQCDSKFSSELALRTHMKTHKPESERRFKCRHEGCSKSFNFSHHLKHHELAHTNDKQHYCTFCGKGFIQSHHLKTHLRSHNPAGWLTCEVPRCQKIFTTDYARKRHMVTHKNKPDSGISSDSNSCNTSISSKEYCEESIKCATCGETILQSTYEIHSLACLSDRALVIQHIKKDPVINNDMCPNTLFKPYAIKYDLSIKSAISRDADDCNKMMEGACILSEPDSRSGQIPNPVKESNDVSPYINNNNDTKDNGDAENPAINLQYDDNDNEMENVDDLNSITVNPLTDCSENKQRDMCEGCDCINICNAKVSLYELTPAVPNMTPNIIKKNNAAPNIEYRPDGVIKIIDTIDDDIIEVFKNENSMTIEKVNLKTRKNIEKVHRFMPFSTCKDVIGNCIASSDDGCLCARMMVVEDQAILAQEIDNITPQPKTEPEEISQ